MKFGVREIIFAAVMVGLLASSKFLVFDKSNAKRDGLKAEIDRKQKALADLDRATVGIEDVKVKIDELQKAITFFENKLPQKRQVETILQEVWQLAEANALKAKKIQTLKNQKGGGGGASEQLIELGLSGDFYGFYAFMQRLERLPRLTRVSKMSLTKINDRDGEMEATLTLSIFYEPEAESETPAPAADGQSVADTR
jgi:Tfp pilus assembly protein PilO